MSIEFIKMVQGNTEATKPTQELPSDLGFACLAVQGILNDLTDNPQTTESFAQGVRRIEEIAATAFVPLELIDPTGFFTGEVGAVIRI